MEEEKNNGSLSRSQEEQGMLKSKIQTQNKLQKFVLLVPVLLVLCGGVAVFFLLQSVKQVKETVVDLQPELDALYASAGVPEDTQAKGDNYGLEAQANPDTPPMGILVFSGRNNNLLQRASLYFLDLSTRSTYIPNFVSRSNLMIFADFNDVVNPTGYFLNAITEASSRSPFSILGVHYHDVQTGKISYFKSAEYPLEAREFEATSDKTKLAYIRMKDVDSRVIDMIDISSWELVILDTSNDVILKKIDGAMHPEWSPDGNKLVYMKPQGLYLYDFVSDTETLVHGSADGQMIAISMIDISPNGEYLAWTITHRGQINMYRIASWDNFTLEEIGRITEPDTHILWPQFSPDSQYYVVQAIDAPKEGETERHNARFEIRPTLGREVVFTHLVPDFDFEQLNTDDWIAFDPAQAE